MAKGIFVADACDADHIPDFVPLNRRDNLRTDIPDRLFTYVLGGTQFVHLLVLRDTTGAPLQVTAQNRCVYWVAGSGVSATRGRNLLKQIKNDAWQTATMNQLRADNGAVATEVKTSPDLLRPLTFDASGNPLTYETALYVQVFGYSHASEADSTTAAEIDAGVAEPLRVRPRSRRPPGLRLPKR